MSKDKVKDSDGTVRAALPGDPYVPDPVVERDLAAPLKGATLKLGVPFQIRGPQGQSPNDWLVVVRLYPVRGPDPLFQVDIPGGANNPFQKQATFNGVPGTYYFYYRYQLNHSNGKWSYWYYCGPYHFIN